MNVRTLALLGASLLVGAVLHTTGCGGGNGNPDGSVDGEADGTTDGGSPFGDAGCKTSNDCDGGVCTANGMCCSSAENVCGGTCCTSGVCLFDSCVTPGAPCHSNLDCAAGQYCEPALGDDGGVSDAGLEAGCSEPLPVEGRCLPLPPTCVGDAGTSADGGLCVADCEYHPPPGGPLTAKTIWNWTSATEYPNDSRRLVHAHGGPHLRHELRREDRLARLARHRGRHRQHGDGQLQQRLEPGPERVPRRRPAHARRAHGQRDSGRSPRRA